jgi:hypothetical protein
MIDIPLYHLSEGILKNNVRTELGRAGKTGKVHRARE